MGRVGWIEDDRADGRGGDAEALEEIEGHAEVVRERSFDRVGVHDDGDDLRCAGRRGIRFGGGSFDVRVSERQRVGTAVTKPRRRSAK